MENVYDKLNEFYLNNPDAKFLFSKKIFERHLRKCAWKKESEEILNFRLKLFSEIILSTLDIDLDSICDLLPEDYLEIFYKLADFENKKLNEKLVLKYIKYVEELLLERESKDFNGKIEEIEFVRIFFYNDGKFYLPEREKPNSYKNLKRRDKFSDDEENHILFLKKQWIDKIWQYFSDDVFEFDVKRASNMFLSAYDNQKVYDYKNNNKLNEEFRDYFLFDYHLIRNDEIPLKFFYKREKDNFDDLSLQILEEYLNSKFTIFYVKKENDDSFLCRDFFHDKEFIFPFTSDEFPEYKNTLFYAHTENSSVVNPFYFSAVARDKEKIQNIVEEIKNAYKLYVYHETNPNFTNFFERHNIAIRKIINEIANTNKTYIIPKATGIETIKTNSNILEDYETPIKKLINIGKEINLSKYSLKLLKKYYHDFLVKSKFTRGVNESYTTLLACLKNFLELNGEEEIFDYKEIIGFDANKISVMRNDIKKLLNSEYFDPRYLTEKGFLNLTCYN